MNSSGFILLFLIACTSGELCEDEFGMSIIHKALVAKGNFPPYSIVSILEFSRYNCLNGDCSVTTKLMTVQVDQASPLHLKLPPLIQ